MCNVLQSFLESQTVAEYDIAVMSDGQPSEHGDDVHSGMINWLTAYFDLQIFAR
jgi:hypothetical protein